MTDDDISIWLYWTGAACVFSGVVAGWGPIPAIIAVGVILMLFSIVKAMVNK